MFIICYKTAKGEKAFAKDESAENFKKTNKDADIIYIFDEKQNIIFKEKTKEESFNNYAQYYGFTSSDYMRPLFLFDRTTKQQEKMQLWGFSPQNRKYKCRVYCPVSNRYYRVTPSEVKKGFELYDDKVFTETSGFSNAHLKT